MNPRLSRWFQTLLAIGHVVADSAEERLRKTALTVLVFPSIFLGLIWGLMYFTLGFVVSGLIPFCYGVVSLLSFTHFALTKRYVAFRFTQLLLILILPFLLQWSLGGFARSSGIMLWALLGPMGALTFHGTRQALHWFGAYIALAVVSGGLDYFGLVGEALVHQSGQISPAVTILIFLMNLVGVSSMAFATLYYFAWAREQAQSKLVEQHRLLQIERDKAEMLLLNILPKSIADRLKISPGTIADAHAEVTVLFGDIVDFTQLSARKSPAQLVALLNLVFTAFDALAEQYGLEKIKTIGDAYMVVGGLPVPRPDHAEAVAEMAIAMQLELTRLSAQTGESLQMRIGINTGPVVAGVIGTKKFIYDLWGDAVNTASRMESHGLAGGIQVTADAYRKLSATYDFEPRGAISVKGKGEILTYFLLGKKANASMTASPSSFPGAVP